MKAMSRKTQRAASALLLSLLLPAEVLAQCAMCNTAAGTGDVGRGLSISVLFLLGTLLAVVLGLVVLVARRAGGRRGPSPARPHGAIE